MAVVSQATRNLLMRHLPTRTDDEIDGLVQEFRHWFRGLADGTSVEDVANGAMDIADELFDASILADARKTRQRRRTGCAVARRAATERLSNSGTVTIAAVRVDTQRKDQPDAPWHVEGVRRVLAPALPSRLRAPRGVWRRLAAAPGMWATQAISRGRDASPGRALV